MRKIKIIGDFFYSIMALCLMHGVLQVIIYPYMNKIFGNEQFGHLISAFGMITIFSASAGLAVNNIQIKYAESKIHKEVYVTAITILGVIGTTLTIVFSYKTIQGVWSWLFFILLSLVMAYRCYGDVYFRVNLNYKKYFLYYVLLSLGYIIGLLFVKKLEVWSVTFLTGELVALFFLFHTKEFGKLVWKKVVRPEQKTKILKLSGQLYVSMLIYYLALNFDKIILLYMINGEAVTVFYVASLLGKTFSLLVGSLNAILLSYLVKYKNKLNSKQFTLFLLGIILLGTVAFILCIILTPIIAYLLYPNVAEAVDKIYFITNLAQILCFMSSLVMTILLYLSNSMMQVKMQTVFTLLLVIISPLLICWKNIEGYAYATLFIYIVKFVIVSIICYKKTRVCKNRIYLGKEDN